MHIYDLRNELNQGKSIYDLPLRVTFYARVSTGTDEQAHSLKNQISYYKDFIEKNSNWSYVDGYIDEALSGTSVTKRESFLKMIVDSNHNEFDLIITKEISRFSRNTLDSIKYTQELLRNGVGVIFQTDNINTLMPDAELRLTIMSSIAQDEVRKISERVKFGFKRAVENGVVLGNSRIWGYTKENGRLVIEPTQAELVKKIFEMYAIEKLGIRAICKALSETGIKNLNGNDFTFTSIRNIIVNPKYKGYYCGNKSQKYDYRCNDRKVFDKADWVMYKDEENVPPIVSQELWDMANKILTKRRRRQLGEHKTSYSNKYKYSCKIICGEHKTYFYRSLFKYKSGDKEVWQCKQYIEKGRAVCSAPVVYTSELDEIMKDAYDQLGRDKHMIIDELMKVYSSINSDDSIKENIAKLKTQISEITLKKDKILDLSIKGMLDGHEFKIRNDGFNFQICQAENKIKDLELEIEQNKDMTKNAVTLEKIISDELDFKNGFDNNIIDTLLDRIEVYTTGESKKVNLKVFFKIFDDEQNYLIQRSKSRSFCYAPHT